MKPRPNEDLDRTDSAILYELQRDGRLTNKELADRVALSQSPCLARVKRLEEAGYIKSYVALLDTERLGLHVNVFVNIRLDSQSKDAIEQFEDHIKTIPEVMECYLMTGRADFLLRMMTDSVRGLEFLLVERLARIPGVRTVESSVAIKQVLYTTAVPT
jgi:Lrp/AsnC family transcriptional regulator, leucine-responsive regulatory protein